MKKYFLGMAAVVLALSLSAFTTPKVSDYVYFEIGEGGEFVDTNNGQQDSTPFDCPDTGLDICAKGYLATDASKVEQQDGEWHLINENAIVDDLVYRP